MSSENPPTFVIKVRKLDGRTLTFKVNGNTTVEDLKRFIQEKDGCPPDQQRLLYNRKQLHDGNLTTHGVVKNSKICLVLKFRGMISRFTGTVDSNPWLCATNENRRNNQMSDQYLKILMATKNASCNAFLRDTQIDILRIVQQRLCAIMDLFHRQHGSPSDLKLVINNPCIEEFQTLMDLHPASDKNDLKIALRRTEPSKNCIEFHVDGEYAVHTVACVLNDNHVGGDVVFVTGDPPTVVNEHLPVGAVTVHHRSILHGVTRLIEGVRYRIFVVEMHNGLGETDVHDITATFMTEWNRRIVSDTSPPSAASSMLSSASDDEIKDENQSDNCIICFTNKRTHLLVPCGHFLYCQICVHNISKKKCAMCRQPFSGIQRVYS